MSAPAFADADVGDQFVVRVNSNLAERDRDVGTFPENTKVSVRSAVIDE
jgi:hypothetical protein